MISVIEYNNFLQKTFKERLESDISLSVHDEFYYDDEATMNVTTKVLPGQIQCGVVQYPVELIIEVNELFTDEVKQCLHNFVIDHNETLIDLEGHTFKQFYATPNVMGTFQSKGIVNNTAISISVSLISYNNVLALSSFTIKSLKSGLSCDVIPISYASAYMVDANATGAVSDQHTRSVGETVGTTYSISIVPKKDKIFIELLELMLSEANPNAKFLIKIAFTDGKGELLTSIEVTAIIQGGNYSQQSNGLPLMELTFIRSDE